MYVEYGLNVKEARVRWNRANSPLVSERRV
jgi:hypothetical protein